jgi:fibronectin-binding autotransporter adhesin
MGDMPSVAGAFTKAGTSTLTLTEANTYTGTTTVSGGALIINGNQSTATGAVGVSNSGTRLMGTGTVGGATTINAAAIHSPGSAIGAVGNQNFSSSLTYASGSIFEWDLATNKDTDGLDDSFGATADNGVAGTDYDAVTVSGTLNIASDAVFKVIQNSGADFSDAFWTSNQNWSNIFNVTGAVTSGWSNTLVSVYNTSNALQDVSTYGSFTITGSTLTWTAVPEPTSALAGILLGFGLLRRRR